ncbi:hypothetical protein BBD42_13095 [Paenibacillus sp. BIHB 4019]|uniref:Uncharacterized protein n=1 Tax=Paenibacillus sp. BIHB 4019 TaxID=1870819 RepID=A0A1B2DHY8_9BACL|nr:hypothetical protein [Paenibacillus sp. BIHB 4019]ANY67306.1 hypothetical protein BBD42_13095 [Paenibacillus sp. BIHB 4019]
MSNIIFLTSSAMFCMSVISFISYKIIIAQQRTINALTDKLMSKDYSEYKRFERHADRDNQPQRKPLSYYDDPSIETDEVQ